MLRLAAEKNWRRGRSKRLSNYSCRFSSAETSVTPAKLCKARLWSWAAAATAVSHTNPLLLQVRQTVDCSSNGTVSECRHFDVGLEKIHSRFSLMEHLCLVEFFVIMLFAKNCNAVKQQNSFPCWPCFQLDIAAPLFHWHVTIGKN